MLVDKLTPTKSDKKWIWAKRYDMRFLHDHCNPGKWIIRRNEDEIDEAWERVYNLVFAEYSPIACAKCVTKLGNIYPPAYVICVYTWNCEDEKDVMKVRDALREIGFTEKLSYKPDWATLNNVDISLYES